MQLTAVFALVVAATVVSAETNAARLARGLPPNAPPGKRATPVLAARNGEPSGGPGMCNTGPVQCCDSLHTAGKNRNADRLARRLGAHPKHGELMGLNCSPITVVGGGGNSCNQQPVCCEDNSFNGILNIGCSPISI